jgi:hypothetical protein
MNQHEWVQRCVEYYKQNDFTPEPGREWQRAHYPAPKGVGEGTIWLMHDHHQVQGILQSEEYGRMCFYPYDAKKSLTEGPFVPGWFELWELYKKWKGENTSEIGRRTVKKLNAHPNTLQNQRENGRKTGPETVKVCNSHPNTKKAREENNKKTAREKSKSIICVEAGVRYPSAMEASRQTGVYQGNISRACRKGWKAGGYHWRFTDD